MANGFENYALIRMIKIAKAKLKTGLNILFVGLGIFFALLMALSLTRIPYDVQVWLGTTDADYSFSPDYIICLGGSGMPSADNLMRLQHTAALYKDCQHATIIIAHPMDSAVIQLMKNELVMRGVDSNKIVFEMKGTSTREQAIKINETISSGNAKIVLVTSPEYMLRSVSAFRKAGFKSVGGDAAFENAMYVNLSYSHKDVGGKTYIPDVSHSLMLRYNFWSYLKLEIGCLRELFALVYYKLNGWI